MLSLSEIAKLIEMPNRIQKSDLAELHELSNKHSYTPIFSLLYLKGVALHQPLDFEEALKKHAFKVPSREQLYWIIQESEVQKQEESEAKPSDVEATENQTEKETTFTFTPEFESQPEKSKEDTTEKPVIIQKPAKQEDDLEKNILAHAVGAAISIEVSDDLNFPVNSNRKIHPKKEVEREVEQTEDPVTEETQKKSAKTPIEKKPTASKGKKSFTEWLSGASDSDSRQASLKTAKKTNPIEEEIDSTVRKTKINQLVEKINTEKTKNTPAPKAFFSAPQKARESLDESGIPVSETLAKIHVAQGNFPKAIEAYQQLMLNFPEKKSFFALRIEELKKKLND